MQRGFLIRISSTPPEDVYARGRNEAEALTLVRSVRHVPEPVAIAIINELTPQEIAALQVFPFYVKNAASSD